MHVVIMSGIPGSGKSTYARALVDACETGPVLDRGRVRIVSADDFHMRTPGDGSAPFYDFKPENVSKAHERCLKNFVREVTSGCSDEMVIVDNTNTTAIEMAPYVALAAAYGHTCEIVLVRASLEEGASRNVHGVPFEVCDRMLTQFVHLSIPKRWNVKLTHVV